MSDEKEKNQEPAPYAYEGLERVIHERARLSIVTSLAANPRGLVFSDLKELCALTDGNLNRHLAVLQQAGAVEIAKSFKNGRSVTICRLTEEGHQRLVEYLGQMEKVLADAAKAQVRWAKDNRAGEPGREARGLRPEG